MDIHEFHKRLQKVSGKEADEFMKGVAYETVNRLLAKTIKRTPVDTGLLRISWSHPENYAPARKEGGAYVCRVKNRTEYASYVEFGHRKPNGGYVEPRRFLTRSAEEIEEELPGIVDIKINKLFDGLWGRK